MTFRICAVVLLGLGGIACGGETPTPDTVPATPAAEAGPAGVAPSVEADTTSMGHAHQAPHGGVLVELGDHFAYLELVLDAETGSLTVYVLDAEAEQALRITQPTIGVTFDAPERMTGQAFTLEARGNVLTGETVGDTSQFGVTDSALKAMSVNGARIREVIVKGQTFRDLVVTPSTQD
ncbi:MAG: hypothetical protein O2917_05990 [Acidobacteria bacterium]|nr:hypothetical protein [Acidobacteriota bacterium]